MKTVLFNLSGEAINDQTITEVTRIEFINKGTEVNVHSAKDGSHLIPTWAVKEIN